MSVTRQNMSDIKETKVDKHGNIVVKTYSGVEHQFTPAEAAERARACREMGDRVKDFDDHTRSTMREMGRELEGLAREARRTKGRIYSRA